MGELGAPQPAYIRRTVQVHRSSNRRPHAALVEFLDLSADLARAASACKEPEGLTKAGKLAFKLYEAKTHFQDTCVYVIGPSDPGIEISKIGVTVNPFGRLAQLQIGNWHRLELKGIMWVLGKATTVERNAHLAAKEMDVWLSGEWMALPGDDAVELALKAARYSKAWVADSNAFLRNMGARVAAVGRTAVVGRENR